MGGPASSPVTPPSVGNGSGQSFRNVHWSGRSGLSPPHAVAAPSHPGGWVHASLQQRRVVTWHSGAPSRWTHTSLGAHASSSHGIANPKATSAQSQHRSSTRSQ